MLPGLVRASINSVLNRRRNRGVASPLKENDKGKDRSHRHGVILDNSKLERCKRSDDRPDRRDDQQICRRIEQAKPAKRENGTWAGRSKSWRPRILMTAGDADERIRNQSIENQRSCDGEF